MWTLENDAGWGIRPGRVVVCSSVLSSAISYYILHVNAGGRREFVRGECSSKGQFVREEELFVHQFGLQQYAI